MKIAVEDLVVVEVTMNIAVEKGPNELGLEGPTEDGATNEDADMRSTSTELRPAVAIDELVEPA